MTAIAPPIHDAPKLTGGATVGPDATPLDPPWLRQFLATQGRGDVPVLRSVRGVADLASVGRSVPSVALINPARGVSDRELAKVGFGHVRRYAVMPSLARARWLIPLDSPAMSAAGFCLLITFRRAARYKQRVARVLARMGVPLWYRDELCLASREPAALEQKIEELFDDDHGWRLSFSLGSPPPARNQKITLAVINRKGQCIAFGKMPGASVASTRSVRREVDILQTLATRPGAPVAPRLLYAGPAGTTTLAVTTPLAGRAPSLFIGAAHRRFLDRLCVGPPRPAIESKLVRALRDGVATLEGRPDLHAAMRLSTELLANVSFPVTLVHGDFAPWNLREHRGNIAAFDWESAEMDGLPLLDEIHYLLAPGYLLGRWTAQQACDRLDEMVMKRPLGLEPGPVRALQMLYLLGYVLRAYSEGHDDAYPRIVWSRQILARLLGQAREG